MKYTTQPFNQADNMILEKRIRGAWLVMGFILFLFFILGLIMMIPSDRSAYAWLMVAGLALLVSLLLVPGFTRLYSDRTDQAKYVGEFPIEKVIVTGKYSTNFYLKVAIEGKGSKIQVKK